MKSIFTTVTVAVLLVAADNARAWLGDSVAELTQRYGPPKTVEQTTGEIPTNQGSYVELRDITSTNDIWMAPPKDGHYLELIERRARYLFNDAGTNIAVYIGEPNEKYGGVDFAGKSAREVMDCPRGWQTNAAGDRVAVPIPFTPAAIDSLIEANKGNSTWSNAWRPIVTPGRFVKLTADKTREAVAYGPSTNQVYRLEFKLVNQLTMD